MPRTFESRVRAVAGRLLRAALIGILSAFGAAASASGAGSPGPAGATDDPASSTAAPARSPARAQRFTLEQDAYALSGEFGGTESTDILYLPLILKSWGERYEFAVVFPYLRVDGPPGVIVGEGSGVPTQPQITGASESRSGPGDVIVRGEYFLIAGDGRRRPWLSALGRLKLPTASRTDGLGTGEVDLSAGVSWTQPWGARLSTFFDLIRKRVGDPPGEDFQDTTAFLAGVSGRLSSRLTGYVMYDREDSIVRGLVAGESLTAGLMVRPQPAWRVSVAVLRGLSDTREDWGGMLGLGRTWSVPRRPRP